MIWTRNGWDPSAEALELADRPCSATSVAGLKGLAVASVYILIDINVLKFEVIGPDTEDLGTGWQLTPEVTRFGVVP